MWQGHHVCQAEYVILIISILTGGAEYFTAICYTSLGGGGGADELKKVEDSTLDGTIDLEEGK